MTHRSAGVDPVPFGPETGSIPPDGTLPASPVRGSFRVTLLSQPTASAVFPTDDDTWALVRDTAPQNAAGWAQEGSLFALADGALGVRGGVEELEDTGGGAFLNTVYDETPIDYHERFTGFARTSDTRVPVADALRVNLEFAGERIGREAMVSFGRRLDLRTGELVRRTLWAAPGGGRVEVEASRVVVGGRLHLRLRLISLDHDGPVALVSWLRPGRAAAAQGDDPRLGAAAGAALDTVRSEQEGSGARLLQVARRATAAVACAVEHMAEGLSLADARSGVRGDAAAVVFEGRLAPGLSVTLEKTAAYAGHAAGRACADDLEARAAAAAVRAAAAGHARARADSAAALAPMWETADLHAGADPALTRALRYDLVQLHRSAPRDGLSGLAAKGITGEGYEGHAFWDSEVFALPVLALTSPDRARSELEFRLATLDAARAHARELDFEAGALYPWRTIGGGEGSAYFPSGSAQLHINAAIAYAVRVYDRVVGDDAFVLGRAAPMVWETARIWMQAGFHDPRAGGAFRICGVTGPDEYSALVDDDHYTNRMARLHLRYALELVARGAPNAPEAAELATWTAAADAMHLPVDPELGVHPQDAAFLGKPRWRFREDRADRPLLLHHHPLTLYRHQVVKQASVVQAHTLDPDGVSRAQMRRDLAYYAPLTAHDSTLSACAHAVTAAAVGRADEALAFLRESALVDLDDLHGNAAHGLHMASMAGGWLGLVMGVAGLRIGDDARPAFLPQAPVGLLRYGFGLVWRGARLRVEVDGPTVAYRLAADSAPLDFVHDGVGLALRAGEGATRPTVRFGGTEGRTGGGRVRAVIFDLDGVLTDTAKAHYAAWKAIADEVGAPFDEAANEALKGVDRMGSLDLILARAPASIPPAVRLELANRKNAHYRRLVAGFGPDDLLPGARAALERARGEGLPLALASASRNAPDLLRRLGVAHFFDVVVDPARLARGKPDPEIFLTAARALGVAPEDCLGVEDSLAGVAAIKAAGMTALGVGDAATLDKADFIVPDLVAVDWTTIQ